jgi:hypothetical protein
MQLGNARPMPHITYPAVHKNAVGSQPCVRYVKPPHAKRNRPAFTQSNVVILFEAGSSNRSEPSSEPMGDRISTLSYVFEGGIGWDAASRVNASGHAEAAEGSARKISSEPRKLVGVGKRR